MPAMPLQPLDHDFYDRPTEVVARELIGRTLIHDTEQGPVGGIIVEAEAYGPDDPASHAFRGLTKRNAAMFGPAGHAYVYRIYGVHWCLNAVTRCCGTGEAVLIRALKPVFGIDIMRRNRGIDDEMRLCRGPGALCAALGITGELDTAELRQSHLTISEERVEGLEVQAATRIGITRAAERPWRFLVAGSPYVSGPRRHVVRERR